MRFRGYTAAEGQPKYSVETQKFKMKLFLSAVLYPLHVLTTRDIKRGNKHCRSFVVTTEFQPVLCYEFKLVNPLSANLLETLTLAQLA
jgi:hypothetical protein